MVATMSVRSVVAAMTLCAAVVMAAVMAAAIGTTLSSKGVIKSQSLPRHLQGIGPQHASFPNASAGDFHRVANAGQKSLVFQNP